MAAALRDLCRRAQDAARDVAAAFEAEAASSDSSSQPQRYSAALIARITPLNDLLQRVAASVEVAAGAYVDMGPRALAAFLDPAMQGGVDVLEAIAACKLHKSAWLVATAAWEGPNVDAEDAVEGVATAAVRCAPLRLLRLVYQLAASILRHLTAAVELRSTEAARGWALGLTKRLLHSQIVARLALVADGGPEDDAAWIGHAEDQVCGALARLQSLLLPTRSGATLARMAGGGAGVPASEATVLGHSGGGSGAGAGSSSGRHPAGGSSNAVVAVGREVCDQLVGLLVHVQGLRSKGRKFLLLGDFPLPAAFAMDGRAGLATAGLLAALLDREQLQWGTQGRREEVGSGNGGSDGSGGSGGNGSRGLKGSGGAVGAGAAAGAAGKGQPRQASTDGGVDAEGLWHPGSPTWVAELQRWLPASPDDDSPTARRGRAAGAAVGPGGPVK